MIISVCLNDAEYAAFLEGFKNSAYRHKSEYVRKLVLGKPVKMWYRNRSMDELVEMGVGLRKDLRRVLAGEAIDPNSKQELSNRLVVIEEQLIKLVKICGLAYTQKKMC